jgi:hypothetical protein
MDEHPLERVLADAVALRDRCDRIAISFPHDRHHLETSIYRIFGRG